jgi:hypothetical protein
MLYSRSNVVHLQLRKVKHIETHNDIPGSLFSLVDFIENNTNILYIYIYICVCVCVCVCVSVDEIAPHLEGA